MEHRDIFEGQEKRTHCSLLFSVEDESETHSHGPQGFHRAQAIHVFTLAGRDMCSTCASQLTPAQTRRRQPHLGRRFVGWLRPELTAGLVGQVGRNSGLQPGPASSPLIEMLRYPTCECSSYPLSRNGELVCRQGRIT